MTWTDAIDFNPDIRIPPAFTFYHDITDGPNGFDPGTDVVYGYDIILSLYDDQQADGPDIAFVDMPGLIGDRVFVNLSGTEYGGWSLAGWLQLNLVGTLTVTVDSLTFWGFTGDFYLDASVLTARGDTPIPEPHSLTLIGIGLLGMAVGLRRRFRWRTTR